MHYGIFVAWIIAALELVSTVMLFNDFHSKRDPLILCMAVIGAGLVYDAVVIGFGGMIILPFLSLLSQVRHILQGVLIPLNILILAYSWTFYRKARIAAWILAIPLMLLGGAAGFFCELDLASAGAITRFVSVSPAESWMERVNLVFTYGAAVPILIAGIRVLIKDKSPSILIGGILMLVLSVLAPAAGNTDLTLLICMFGELFLLLSYLIYEKRHING